MYLLDPSLDLSQLIGARLLQVCLGENEIIFHFYREVMVKCESRLSVFVPSRGITMIEHAPAFGVFVGTFLGKQITMADVVSNTDIRITLGDCWIQLHGGTERHEDYELKWNETHIIV